MSTLVPRPDTRPVARPGTALAPLDTPAPPPAIPAAACPVPPRRPTSGIPIVGYVTPPPYECTRTRTIFRRLTIEIVRTSLWVLALIPFIVINSALLTRSVLRAHARALTRLLTRRAPSPAGAHPPPRAHEQPPSTSAATLRCVDCATTTVPGPAGEVPRGWFHRLGVGLLCPACLAADLHLPARTFQ